VTYESLCLSYSEEVLRQKRKVYFPNSPGLGRLPGCGPPALRPECLHRIRVNQENGSSQSVHSGVRVGHLRQPVNAQRESRREFRPSRRANRRVVFGCGLDALRTENRLGACALANPRARANNKNPDGLHHQGSVYHSAPLPLAACDSGSPDRKLLEPRWPSRPRWLQPELRGEGGQPRPVPGPSVSTCWSSRCPGLRKRSLRESRHGSLHVPSPLGFPVLRSTSLAYMPTPLPRRDRMDATAASSPSDDGLPRKTDGSAPASLCFDACSAFTHVSACMLAGSPKVIRYIRGFDGFVTSSAAPTASGWSDPSPGGIRTH